MVLGGTAACAAAGDAGPASTVRDSAGVAIVENVRPAWRPEEAWRMADAPALQIGVVEGDARYQLDRVRGAARLSDGRIVVLDAGTDELRAFGPDGRHLATLGGPGEGPGELRNPWGPTVLPGDSVAVYDTQLRRVSVYHPDRGFVRSFRVELPGGELPSRIAAFGDGSLLVRAYVPEEDVVGGAQRRAHAYYRLSGDGEVLTRIGEFPGDEVFVTLAPAYGEGALMFGRDGHAATHGDRLYYGSADEYRVEVYGPTGTLERDIRRRFRRVAVTAADIEAESRAWLEPLREHEAWVEFVRGILAAMPYPERFPAHRAIRVDRAGNLWVREYGRPGEERERWTVFDGDGRMLGEVAMPAGLTVLDVGPDHVLGRWRDDLDVDYVRLYPLVRP